MSEAHILESVNPKYDDRLFIDSRLQYKKNTSCAQKCFWMPKQKQKTIFVHKMFWTCILLVLKSGINEQSVVILWVNWFKNECFWQRFTCKNIFCCIPIWFLKVEKTFLVFSILYFIGSSLLSKSLVWWLINNLFCLLTLVFVILTSASFRNFLYLFSLL